MVVRETMAPAAPARLELSKAEQKVTRALMRCIGRWGLGKTTIEDVASESGVSRATVYRLFPGGKTSIVYLAVRSEVQDLIAQLVDELAKIDNLEDCLTAALNLSAMFLDEHPALSYMREYESAEFEQIMSFERMDLVFASCGAALVPVLSSFLPESAAFDAGMWGARLLVSYLSEESVYLDLRSADDARVLVRNFIIPGLLTDGGHGPEGQPVLETNRSETQ